MELGKFIFVMMAVSDEIIAYLCKTDYCANL